MRAELCFAFVICFDLFLLRHTDAPLPLAVRLPTRSLSLHRSASRIGRRLWGAGGGDQLHRDETEEGGRDEREPI